MKARTFLELATLSTTLYTISKETHLIDRLSELSEQGKEKLNAFMKEQKWDEDGKEMEFVDRLLLKAKEAKDELNQQIGEMVAAFYAKVNIAHTDQMDEMKREIELLKKSLALAEARINHLENSK